MEIGTLTMQIFLLLHFFAGAGERLENTMAAFRQ